MDLFEFEAVIDGVDAPAGEPAADDVTPDEPAIEAAPPAPTFSRDDPEFQAAVAETVQSMFGTYGEPLSPQAEPGDPVDWNERLNPLGDNYGQSLVELLADRDKWLISEYDKRLDQRLEPLTSRELRANEEAGNKLVEQFISEKWQPITDGPLTEKHTEAIKSLSMNFLTEENSRFGITDENRERHPMAQQAARQALTRASQVIKEINQAARAEGSQANIDGLAALTSAPGEPGTGGGAHSVPPPAKSPQELLDRYFPQVSGHNN